MTPSRILEFFSSAPARGWKQSRAGKLGAWKMTCGVFLLCTATSVAAHAQTFTLLATFEGANGDQPTSLVQGADGNLYGTTTFGGTPCVNWAGCGTVFKMNAAGKLETLYSFGNPISDGVYPPAGLVLATDGNFYGVTGTPPNVATVFRISPSGTLTKLYQFCSQPNCSDG